MTQLARAQALSDLTHFKMARESKRLLPFWSNRGLHPDFEVNQSEILTRADILIDGLEMLVPQHTPAQRQLVREAIQHVERAVMVTHGAYVSGERRS